MCIRDRVPLHRRVDEPLDLGERHDLVELADDLLPMHAEDRAVEEHLLAPGQIGMESRTDLEQRADATLDRRTSGRWRRKSTAPERTVAIGIARRGKYNLVTSYWLATTLLADWVNPFAKNVQGTSAAKLKSGYGTPSDGTFARFPKKRLNTTIVSSGWMIAHEAPSAVCL